MEPGSFIVWTCLIIFVITAILTLLHITGIWRLHDPKHGEILFKILIVEVVIICLTYFSGTLPNNESIDNGTDESAAVDSGKIESTLSEGVLLGSKELNFREEWTEQSSKIWVQFEEIEKSKLAVLYDFQPAQGDIQLTYYKKNEVQRVDIDNGQYVLLLGKYNPTTSSIKVSVYKLK